MKHTDIKTRPWCPFCGQTIARPQPPVERKLGEFSVGSCQCGAVYACDPTGHNIGSAMIEALVYACNDDWDLAWTLIPEEDYLTGRLENYDEVTHQVVETRNLDGRFIRGVIYFVRLHKSIAEITRRVNADQEGAERAPSSSAGSYIPAVEPERDPKRKKKRADKTTVRQMVDAFDIDGLVDLTFDDIRTLRFLQRLLYDPDEDKRWRTAHIIGQVCARLATRRPGPVSDLLHRMFESCSDSASTNWGLVEAIGAIIGARPDIFGAFTRHLLRYVSDPGVRVQVVWALGTIAAHRPDLVRNIPFYQLFDLLEADDASLRGHMLRLLGRIRAREAAGAIEKMTDDQSAVTVYEQGKPVRTTVASLAKEALNMMQN